MSTFYMGTTRRTSASVVHQLLWPRFSEYQVVGGTHVAPAPGARLELYDPFQEYEESARERRRVNAYASLVNINLGDTADILGWCQQHGLLGILSHRTLLAYLSPTWAYAGPPIGQSFSKQRVYHGLGSPQPEVRFRFQHPVDLRTIVDRSVKIYQSGRTSGGMVAKRDGVPYEKPYAIITDPQERPIVVDIAEAVGRFFPYDPDVVAFEHGCAEGRIGVDKLSANQLADVRKRLNKADYPLAPDPQSMRTPLPISERGLARYGEPIDLIRNYMVALACRIDFHGPVAAAMYEDRSQMTFSGPTLNLGLRATQPMAFWDQESDSWKLGWTASSLYGAMHLMALLDLQGGRSLRRCGYAKCSKFVLAQRAKPVYCSDPHKRTAQTGRYRFGIRARRLYAKGIPLRRIAHALGTDLPTVRRCLRGR